MFVDFEEPIEREEEKEEDKEVSRIRELLEKSVEEMELSVRSANCLRAAGIKTIGELVQKSGVGHAQVPELRPEVAQGDQRHPEPDGTAVRHGHFALHEAGGQAGLGPGSDAGGAAEDEDLSLGMPEEEGDDENRHVIPFARCPRVSGAIE